MLLESRLYLAANLALFAAVLLGWLSVRFRPRSRSSRWLLILFSAMQAVAIAWAVSNQGYAMLARTETAIMVAVEASALLCIWEMRLLDLSVEVASAITLSFVVHSYAMLRMWPSAANAMPASPFVNVLFALYTVTVAAAAGAYVCAAGASLAWLGRRAVFRVRTSGEGNSEPDAPPFSGRALMLAYPISTASVMVRGAWNYLALGTCWSWDMAVVSLLSLWLVLTITLHLADGARWRMVRALLVLVGLLLALVALSTIGQPATVG